jgi:hypothetical protein
MAWFGFSCAPALTSVRRNVAAARTRFRRDTRGTVTLLVTMVLLALLGIVGLVVDYGAAMVLKAQDQRVAEITSFAGGLAYGSANQGAGALTAVVSALAQLNGLPANSMTPHVVSSPSNDGNPAVQVTASTTTPTSLSRLLSGMTALTEAALAASEIRPAGMPCLIALSGSGSGVTLSGGTSVNASCTVASNSSVSVPCGTSMQAAGVTYATTLSTPCNGITPTTGHSSVAYAETTVNDPLRGNAQVASLRARLATVAEQSAPAAPVVSGGGNVELGYSASSSQSQLGAVGCSGTFASSSGTWTVTCSGSTIAIAALTIDGGITALFNTGGAAGTTYNFSGAITVGGGSSLTFGPGTFNIAGGVYQSGSTLTFGSGTFNAGRGGSACNGGGRYSICVTNGTMTVGATVMTLQGGIYVGGGDKATLGAGASNSYDLGASSDGNAIYTGGGATLTMASATGSGSLFQAAGNIDLAGGGSCTALPAAAQHDIDGNLTVAGGVTLGAGVYTVTGYIGIGMNGTGGDVTCNGVSTAFSGSNITFVIGAGSTPMSGDCLGLAFCLGAGYSGGSLTAPTSGADENLLMVGPASASAGAAITEGAASTTMTGVMYFPGGSITLDGGASVASGAGQCLAIVGTAISVEGGTSATTSCPSAGGTAFASAAKVVE